MVRRTRHVLLYAGALLGSPLLILLGQALTNELSPGGVVGGPLLALASYVLFREEWRSSRRGLLRSKLLATSFITFWCGLGVAAASLYGLAVRPIAP